MSDPLRPATASSDPPLTEEHAEVNRMITESVLRSLAREIVLRGDADPATVTDAELRELAERELVAVFRAGEVDFGLVIDHSDTILRDARRHVDERRFEYAFVYYGLYVEHLLNRAIRDRAVQIDLAESETVDVMKKSIHEKTGLTWRLLFGERMPEAIAADIRELTARRNAFMHYKWKPDPTADMLHDEIEQRTTASIATAERAAEALRAYTDALIAPPESDVFDWLTRSHPAASEKETS